MKPYLLIAAAALLCACQSSKPVIVPPEEPPEEVAGMQPLSVAYLLSEKFQPDIKVKAYAEGNTVSVQVQNVSDMPVGLQAENFGLILKDSHEVLPFDPEVHTSNLHEIVLRKGEIASAQLVFHGLGDLAGWKIVFQHKLTRPSVQIIQGPNLKEPAVPLDFGREEIQSPVGGPTPAPPPSFD